MSFLITQVYIVCMCRHMYGNSNIHDYCVRNALHESCVVSTTSIICIVHENLAFQCMYTAAVCSVQLGLKVM